MLVRLSAPDGLAAPLENVKDALKVSAADDDELISRIIRQETTRYEDFTGRLMLPTDLEWRAPGWCDPIVIDAFPVREVSEVVYLDEDDAEQTLDAGDWYTVETDSGFEVRFTDAFSSPTLSDQPLAVRVRFSAGYDEPGASGAVAEPEAQDEGVITAMVGWQYDRGEAMPEDLLRRMAGNRRIFR